MGKNVLTISNKWQTVHLWMYLGLQKVFEVTHKSRCANLKRMVWGGYTLAWIKNRLTFSNQRPGINEPCLGWQAMQEHVTAGVND